MDHRSYSIIALLVTMAFGVGFIFVPDSVRGTYAVVGGLVIAAMWVARGLIGRRSHAPATAGSGESPQDRLA